MFIIISLENIAKNKQMEIEKKAVTMSHDAPVIMLFQNYSKSLDKKYDKYERIYKANRDVTLRSKKVIFSLQRIPGLSEKEKMVIIETTSRELRDVEQTLLKHIAMELRDEEPFQFINAYTGGIQEYIEAVTFQHFLLKETLLGLSDIQERLTFGDHSETETDVIPLSVMITGKEYMLGVADMTGELMRFCIKSVSVGDFEMSFKICDALREMYAGFLSLGYIQSKELYHKMLVLRSSVNKVENVRYTLHLRKSEMTPEMLSEMLAIYDGTDDVNVSVIA